MSYHITLLPIIQAAQSIQSRKYKEIVFLIYGDGDDKEKLEQYCIENKIDNVRFKGRVEKKYVPYILSNASVNILHFNDNKLKKYGASLNKMFEYFASEKPSISDSEFGYDLIKRYNCGVVLDKASPEKIGEEIIRFYAMSEDQYGQYSRGAFKAANFYDFQNLTQLLVEVLEK